ncbi:MAG: hypothetical protein FJ026_07040 [Chloroflexi bacterium]|nr:hypothetical protein [Chloroflexota bacterium]
MTTHRGTHSTTPPEDPIRPQPPPPTLKVDTGAISVALAVAGISAAFAAQGANPVLRLLAALAFILAVVSAFELYWVYLLIRVPDLIAGVYQAGRGRLKGFFWLVRRWFQLLRNALRGVVLMPPEEYLSLGLLNLLAAMLVLVSIVAASAAISASR